MDVLSLDSLRAIQRLQVAASHVVPWQRGWSAERGIDADWYGSVLGWYGLTWIIIIISIIIIIIVIIIIIIIIDSNKLDHGGFIWIDEAYIYPPTDSLKQQPLCEDMMGHSNTLAEPSPICSSLLLPAALLTTL